MKQSLLLFATVTLFSLAGCKSKSETTTSGSTRPVATSDPTVYKGVTNDSCAVEVSFGSYAAGIDGKAYDQIMAKINEKKLKYSSKSIGREGEQRVCLPLTELKSKEKTEFIDQLKKIASGAELVSVSIR